MNFRVNVELLLLEVKYFLKQRVYLASFKFAFNLLLRGYNKILNVLMSEGFERGS